MRLGCLAAAVLTLAACAAPTPTPTATPTPTPRPTLTAEQAEAHACLLSPACSGLSEPVVRKSAALRAASESGAPAKYWIDPAVLYPWELSIQRRIMPTIAEWTHTAWEQVNSPGPGVLLWHGELPEHWRRAGLYSPECLRSACALPGLDEITFRIVSFHSVPSALIYLVGLHEAVHALYGFDHAHRGIMCIEPECLTPLEEWGLTWELLTLDDLDRAVFTLYGSYPHGYELDGGR